MTLGTRIANLRHQSSLSQQALADILGVSQATIAKHEKDVNTVSADMLVMYADFFSVSTDYLLCRTDHPELVTHPVLSPQGERYVVHALPGAEPLSDISSWIQQAESRISLLEHRIQQSTHSK